MRILHSFALSLVLTLGAATSSPAHEFWIDPLDFQVDLGETIAAQLRVGQNFDGTNLVYHTNNFTRFELVVGDTVTPVTGRLGDRPAMAMPAPAEGLGIVLHETSTQWLTYTDWTKFTDFVAHKGFAGALDRHAERGLPQTGFTELYSRHVKSLVAIGAGAGQDREFGLLTEFVALANPYADDLSAGLPVRLLLRGQPRAQAQVELWQRAPDGAVTVTVLHTDDAGEVTLPVIPGNTYMADAVVLEELGPGAARDAVWISYWAALTFAVPAP